MEITIISGRQTFGRNFPQFGTLTVTLPAGTHDIVLRPLNAASTSVVSYSVNVRGR
jgi:hypothetical protein